MKTKPFVLDPFGGLGDFAPNQELLNQIKVFETGAANATATVAARITDQSSAYDYVQVLATFQNRVLAGFFAHPVFGVPAQRLNTLINQEVVRAGLFINEQSQTIIQYGGTPRYGYTPGVGVRVL